MLEKALDIVFRGVSGAFDLFSLLDSYFGVLWVLIGFFTAFTIYRFLIRPLVGGGFVDPSSVLQSFKGQDSDAARKGIPQASSGYLLARRSYLESRSYYLEHKTFYDSHRLKGGD